MKHFRVIFFVLMILICLSILLGCDDSPTAEINKEDGTQQEEEVRQEEQILNYNLTVLSSNTKKGVVNGGGKFKEGDSVTVAAISKSGYTFAGWKDGDIFKSESKSYTFVMPKNNVTLVAEFVGTINIELQNSINSATRQDSLENVRINKKTYSQDYKSGAQNGHAYEIIEFDGEKTHGYNIYDGKIKKEYFYDETNGVSDHYYFYEKNSTWYKKSNVDFSEVNSFVPRLLTIIVSLDSDDFYQVNDYVEETPHLHLNPILLEFFSLQDGIYYELGTDAYEKFKSSIYADYSILNIPTNISIDIEYVRIKISDGMVTKFEYGYSSEHRDINNVMRRTIYNYSYVIFNHHLVTIDVPEDYIDEDLHLLKAKQAEDIINNVYQLDFTNFTMDTVFSSNNQDMDINTRLWAYDEYNFGWLALNEGELTDGSIVYAKEQDKYYIYKFSEDSGEWEKTESETENSLQTVLGPTWTHVSVSISIYDDFEISDDEVSYTYVVNAMDITATSFLKISNLGSTELFFSV